MAAVRLSLLFLLGACSTAPVAPDRRGPQVAHLGPQGYRSADLAAIAKDFTERNSGYSLSFHPGVRRLPALPAPRIAFVQRGAGRVLNRDVGVGDLILLRPGQALATSEPLDLLVFGVPEPLPDDLPAVLRPDWTPGITDVPGGCATEEGAYRRVVLTWLHRNGPFNYRALNAHRVRITDSFTHYHPLQGGFDEFYLVQMVQPGAALLTSRQTAAIVAETVDRAAVEGLLQRTELRVGDLVYLPRGMVHRGLGGVLAHVITAPGFVPGAELGVDHHLAALNKKLGVALPVHGGGQQKPIGR